MRFSATLACVALTAIVASSAVAPVRAQTADRMQALRAAFDATMVDPEFLADTNKQKLEVAAKKGADLQDIVESIYSTPRAVVDQTKDLLPTSSD